MPELDVSRLIAIALACGLALAGCGKTPTPAAAAKGAGTQAAAEVKPKGKPEPAEEPSERVLTKLLMKDYQLINEAGGMPVVVTATGKELVLKPKLYDARKDSCRKMSENIGGGYECSMIVMITLKDDGSKPKQSGERVRVYWDAEEGEWASGQRKRNKK